jgi:hypothetical protein
LISISISLTPMCPLEPSEPARPSQDALREVDALRELRVNEQTDFHNGFFLYPLHAGNSGRTK